MTISTRLETLLRRALDALPEPPPTSFPANVTAAADTRFGDYQANAAMTLAKQRRTNPRGLATAIAEALNADPELAAVSAPVEVAGAGFLNFRLTPAFLGERLAALLADPERLGVTPVTRPERIVIDFSSPNIAKPMHVGHLRSTILGDCLARVSRFLGHTVMADNHLGDWGTQFGKVIYGWNKYRNEAALIDDPLNELVRIYQLANADCIKEEAKQLGQRTVEFTSGAAQHLAEARKADLLQPSAIEVCREELAKLQSGDPENVAIWQRSVDISRAELDKIYARLGIRFDYYLGESFYNPKLDPLVKRLLKQAIAEPSEGAIVIFFRENERLADTPAIIQKRDGAFNYMTTDLATLEHRTGELGATAMWNVVGAPQSLHFEQVNAAGRKMGITVPATHIPFGSILGEDRKLMRTRSGESVALRDLLDEAETRARVVVEEKQREAAEFAAAQGRPAPEPLPDDEKAEIARRIGLGAVRYAELSQGRMTDYVFSWDRMLSFQGNTAPYLQNAYVRIRSIFRKAGEEFEISNLRFQITEPAELALAKKLAQFAEVVPAILDDFRPNSLATYLFELANHFHAFYEACPVLKAGDPAVRATRLALCEVTGRVLARGLGLMGIEVPERM